LRILSFFVKDAKRSLINNSFGTPNAKVQILNYKPGQLDPRASAPFSIVRIYANGAVTLQRALIVTERINIRRFRR
jgi:hypothetical protein